MKLTTKRLILREVRKTDAESIRKYIDNLNISKWLLAVPYPYTKKDALWWVNECEKKQETKTRTSYELGLTIKPNDEVVGGIGLSHIEEFSGTAEIGYWIAEPFWRKGYMLEATKKLIDFGFNKLKLRRIELPAFSKNQGSNRLAKKLGFKFEGTLRKNEKAKSTGKIHDKNVWGLLKSDWPKPKKD